MKPTAAPWPGCATLEWRIVKLPRTILSNRTCKLTAITCMSRPLARCVSSGGALSRRARGLRALYRRLSQAAQFPLSANQWRRSHRAAYRRRTAPVVQHNTGALLLASLASCEALRHSWGLAIRSRSHMELAWQITSLQHTSDKPRTIYELQISPQTRSALFCHASQHDFPC